MDVELAEERILLLADKFSMEQAEGRAWSKRVEAFGTMARLTGMFSRPKDEEFEVIYRERRLQPFWRISCNATYVYECGRDFRVPVAGNVTDVRFDDKTHPVESGAFVIHAVELCRDETHRESLFEAIGGRPDPGLTAHLKAEATPADTTRLQQEVDAGSVVVPPQAKASMLIRDVLASAITRIAADAILEERVAFDAVDLYYRPVYAFRYRWQGKEAVVEFDGITGDARPGGETFERYVGEVIDAEFLINAGVEAAGLFIPGVRLAEIVISKSLKARQGGPGERR